MMYHIINIFLEVIKPNNFALNVNVCIFEEILNHDIVITNLQTDSRNSCFFVDLVFRDEYSGNTV